MNRNAQKVDGKQEGVRDGPEADILPIPIGFEDLDGSERDKNDVSPMVPVADGISSKRDIVKDMDELADSLNPLE